MVRRRENQKQLILNNQFFKNIVVFFNALFISYSFVEIFKNGFNLKSSKLSQKADHQKMYLQVCKFSVVISSDLLF